MTRISALLLALCVVLSGAFPALADDLSIIGTWERDDGHSVSFREGDSGEIEGVVADPGPAAEFGFSAGEVSFRMHPTADPDVYQGEAKWRSMGGEPEWKPQTMTVSGDAMTGLGAWTRQGVGASLFSSASSLWGAAKAKAKDAMDSEEMQSMKQGAGELWDATKEKSAEVMASEEMQSAKKEAGEMWDAAREKSAEVMASDEVAAAKRTVADLYNRVMASLFGVDSVQPAGPEDGIPIPEIPCEPFNEVSEEGYGFNNVQEQYFARESVWIGFDGPGTPYAWYGLYPAGKAIKDEFVDFSGKLQGNRLGSHSHGMFSLSVPARPGCYELIMTDSTAKDANVLARISIKVVPDEDTPVPALFIPRAVFGPGEFIAAEVPEETVDASKAFVALVPAEAEHGLFGVVSRLHKGYVMVKDAKDGVLGFGAPREPGKYSLRLYSHWGNDGQELTSSDFEVREVQWGGKPLIALDSEAYESGRAFSVVYNAMPDWPAKAWIALVPADVPHGNSGVNDKHDIAYLNLRQTKTGTWKVVAPKQPGRYELRMLDGNGSSSKEVFVAGFEVVLPSGYADREPSMKIMSAEARAFGSMEVEYVSRKDWSSKSWIGFVRKGTPADGNAAYKAALARKSLMYADEGVFDFGLPADPGPYELRMYGGADANQVMITLPVEVLPALAEGQGDAEAEAEAQALLDSLPEYDEFEITDEQFEQFFHVPEIPVVDIEPGDGGEALGNCSQCGKTAQLREEFLDLLRQYYPDQAVYLHADVTDATPPMLRTVAHQVDSECIDREIEIMTKLDLTLGRDNQFAQALTNMAMTFATKWKLPIKSGEKINQAINMANDTYTHGGAAIAAMQKGDYTDVVLQSMTMVIKNLMTACGDAACFNSVRKTADEMLLKYVKKLPAGKKAEFLNRMRAAIGSDPFIRRLEEAPDAMNVGLNVDTGTAVVEGGSDYKRAIWTLTSSAMQMHPATATALAVGTAGYEGMVAMRDFIVDDTTRNLYAGYKEAFDGGKEGDAVWAGLSRGYAFPYHKVRELMIANPTNPMVRKALTEGHQIRSLATGGAALKAEQISDEEIESYLKMQFETWREKERKGSDFSRFAKEIKKDFETLDCPLALFNKLEEARKQKSTYQQGKEAFTNWMEGTCKDGKAFAAYARMRHDIETDMAKWSGGKGCSKVSPRYESKKLACVLLEKGPSAYRRGMSELAKKCDWKPKVESWAALHYSGKIAKLNAGEKKFVKFMEKIGRTDLLNCMCRNSKGIVSARFHPQLTKGESPSCDRGSGACIGGNFGCVRFNIKSSAMKACGVAQAIADYKKKNRKR
ncbi:hypothetical protein GM415_02360 [Pseudodesulfovibrio cashew]|uniref:Uncharacterized protein n=1 Tax=Pseudodesulfovibrio cashew TaxID=2678688 RepID=A0A6I6J8W8_9BACT|nr:hypothetical protein [Pseudodesulfovibrio cashew]QGY39025.1 hypothetical protein GM415_02360 [Pseudodesulfovibrio cashew]